MFIISRNSYCNCKFSFLFQKLSLHIATSSIGSGIVYRRPFMGSAFQAQNATKFRKQLFRTLTELTTDIPFVNRTYSLYNQQVYVFKWPITKNWWYYAFHLLFTIIHYLLKVSFEFLVFCFLTFFSEYLLTFIVIFQTQMKLTADVLRI